MPTKTTNKPEIHNIPPAISVARVEAQRISTPLIEKAAMIVTCGVEYQDASLLRANLQNAQKAIEERLDKIIRPSYEALQSLYELKRELTKPIVDATGQLTGQMRQFKLLEARKIQEEETARKLAEQALIREAEEKMRAAERAKTPQMQSRMKTQATTLATRAQEVALTPTEAPVKAVGSTVRKYKRVEITDFAKLIKGVASGDVPEDVLEVNMGRLGEYLKLDEKAVADMPGVAIIEDIRIVGK